MRHAVVVADRLGVELAPLNARTCVALLPVAGKPLICHALETLAQVGVEEVLVLVSPFVDEVRGRLGDGEAFGLHLTYALTRGEEHPATVLGRLSRFGRRPDGEFLALRGDVVLGFDLARWLTAARAQAGADESIWAAADGRSAGCGLHRAGLLALEPIGWPLPETAIRPEQAWLPVPAGQAPDLPTLAAYHQANLAAIGGRLPGLAPAGVPRGPGLWVGGESRLPSRALRAGPCLIGARCRVAGGARLNGDVVLGDDVIVGDGARLRASLVLPHTYVGPGVEVTNAILRGNMLIRVDTGVVVHITDHWLLADRAQRRLGGGLVGLAQRGLGLVALLGSLPLWPLALLATAWERRDEGGPWLQPRVLLGNREVTEGFEAARRRPFRVWEWQTPIPVLRRLPWLLAVVGGDLRLVGVTPLPPDLVDALLEDWERVREEAPVGLVGPTQLDVPADAPLEECLMSDACYARQHSPGQDLRYLLRGFARLFQGRAWRPAAVAEDQ